MSSKKKVSDSKKENVIFQFTSIRILNKLKIKINNTNYFIWNQINFDHLVNR